MNPMTLLQLKSAWDKFQKRHPKFPHFLKAVSEKGISEGTVIEINVTAPGGQTFASNLKVGKEDMELVQELKSLSEKGGTSRF